MRFAIGYAGGSLALICLSVVLRRAGLDFYPVPIFWAGMMFSEAARSLNRWEEMRAAARRHNQKDRP